MQDFEMMESGEFEKDGMTGTKMPVLFVGHGSPMHAIEDSRFSRAWKSMAGTLPKPRAILCISAHWETEGVKVTAMSQPLTLHDFYGFPQALFQKKYPAPGSPELARLVRQSSTRVRVEFDYEWGLDHGAWGPLCRMYPEADIPVVQLSIDEGRNASLHYELAKELAALRSQGVLVLASGNLVHNLETMRLDDSAYDWALEFDDIVKHLILSGNHDALIRFRELGPSAHLAVPSTEHYMPLMYALALQEANDPVEFFAEGVTMGSVSMRSIRIG